VKAEARKVGRRRGSSVGPSVSLNEPGDSRQVVARAGGVLDIRVLSAVGRALATFHLTMERMRRCGSSRFSS